MRIGVGSAGSTVAWRRCLARPFSQAHDPLAGYFVIPQEVYRRAAALDPVGYKIGLELLVKAGCTNVQEVPIQFADRRHGTSKLTLAEQLRYLRHLKKLADFKYTGCLAVRAVLSGGRQRDADRPARATCCCSRSGCACPLARGVAIVVAMNWNFALNNRITFAGATVAASWCGTPVHLELCVRRCPELGDCRRDADPDSLVRGPLDAGSPGRHRGRHAREFRAVARMGVSRRKRAEHDTSV